MSTPPNAASTTPREAPLEITPERFREIGHALVDRIALHLAGLRDGKVTPGGTPAAVRAALGQGPLPERGADPARVIEEAATLLFEHSLYNGHPRFFGYITSSAAPIGALGDLLAATVNANVSFFQLAPMATEIERQTVRWIAELIRYPVEADGILVSGGNMANMVAFLAARRARGGEVLREQGLAAAPRLKVYASTQTHNWIQKACDLFGLGTGAIRWIEVDDALRMDVAALSAAVRADRAAGATPWLVVATAGSVSTGAVDPLAAIAEVCRAEDLWLHADGAYGGLAAALPDAPADLHALALADSVAVDPHKWLYAPIEAGCTLVRHRDALADAFAWRPPYYHFAGDEEPPFNFYERGPQNTRGFRALKVWLGLRQAGREGAVRGMADDVALARRLHARVLEHPRLEAFDSGLSIVAFRYVPEDVTPGNAADEEYLNRLNTEVLTRLQSGGRAYTSNAVLRGAFVLRACIVNFRTGPDDVDALPGIVAEIGAAAHRDLRAAATAGGSRVATGGPSA